MKKYFVLALSLVSLSVVDAARASDVPDNMLSQQVGTNRRPDLGVRIENASNRDIVVSGDTYCAHFPSAFTVKANSTTLAWAEGKHGGSCYAQSKRTDVKIAGTDFQINGFAKWLTAGGFPTNLPWEINVQEAAGVTVVGYEMSGLDRIITIRVR